MEACEIPQERILPAAVIHLMIDEDGCGLECAMETATRFVHKYGNEPRLLSWYDRKGQNHSLMDECCVDGQPSWIASAEARGANLTVDVNNEDYVFIFHQSVKFQ